MLLDRSSGGVVAQAPAKLNLFFEVLGKRPDGFHEIETLVYAINLYDTLYFKEDPNGQVKLGRVRFSQPHRPRHSSPAGVPTGRDNLVVRAVELLRNRAGVDRGAEIRLVKRIPSEAGLGGGSSDAAAALAAANLLWRLDWSRAQLAELGAELGSDVPLFFQPRAALCRGRGEQADPAHGVGVLHLVVVRPPAGLSTARVYAACRPGAEPRSAAPLLEALRRGDLAQAGRRMFNRLQPAAERLSPWIARLRDEFSRTDCLGHQMTGSGTCYFGLCRQGGHARRIARQVAARGLGNAYAVRGSPTPPAASKA